MTHVFISYAKVDTRDLAIDLDKALNAVPGLSAWMDASLRSGDSWARRIESEIDRADLVIVLLSPDVNRAKTEKQDYSFVLKEVEYAQAESKPILLAMAKMTKVPIELRGIQYADLTKSPDNGLYELVETACHRLGIESPSERERREQREAEEKERLLAEAEKERLRLEKLEADRKAEEERLQREAIELAERQRREAAEAAERQRVAKAEAELRAQKLAQAQELLTAGDEYLAVDNWTDALAQYQQASNLIPDDTDLANRVMTLQRIAQDSDHLQHQIKFLYKLNDSDRHKQLIQLKSQLSPLIDLLPDSPRLKELQQQLNEQLEAMRQELITTGDQYLADDNWTEALNAYQSTTRLYPTDAESAERYNRLMRIQQERQRIQQMFRELNGGRQSKIQQLEAMQQRLTPLLEILPDSQRLQKLQTEIKTEHTNLNEQIEQVKWDRNDVQAAPEDQVVTSPPALNQWLIDNPNEAVYEPVASKSDIRSRTQQLRTLGMIGGGVTVLLVLAITFIIPLLSPSVPVLDILSPDAEHLSLALQQANARVTTDWQPVSSLFEDMEMVLVPGGCLPTESRGFSKPITPGVCQSAFWIDRYEVTNSTYEPGKIFFNQQNLPYDSITLNEAITHCQQRGARLPTNAEWEYAALGASARRYPWGNLFLSENVVYAGNSSGKSAVGSKPDGASWVGALDMSGNVWEWVKSPGIVLINIRGGSWKDTQFYTLYADAGAYVTETDRYDNVGFRCAREITNTTTATSTNVLNLPGTWTATWTRTPTYTPTAEPTRQSNLPTLPSAWTQTPSPTVTIVQSLPTLDSVTVTINAAGSSGVNIRQGPNTAYPRLGFAMNGETFPILAVVNYFGIVETWYLIEIFGRTGWVSGDLVTIDNPNNVIIPQVTITPIPAYETATANFYETLIANMTQTDIAQSTQNSDATMTARP